VLIEGNRVENGRDVVLWYSEKLTVRENQISGGRYGLHFMYCDDATIRENQLLGNSVGAFLMYSRRLNLVDNTIAFNRGPSGYGVGLKDMDDAQLIGNLFYDNRIGAHLDNSPREIDSIGLFEGNIFGFNDIGVSMMPSVRHNSLLKTALLKTKNRSALRVGVRSRTIIGMERNRATTGAITPDMTNGRMV
jgi:nitrous oxidase accessory protein